MDDSDLDDLIGLARLRIDAKQSELAAEIALREIVVRACEGRRLTRSAVTALVGFAEQTCEKKTATKFFSGDTFVRNGRPRQFSRLYEAFIFAHVRAEGFNLTSSDWDTSGKRSAFLETARRLLGEPDSLDNIRLEREANRIAKAYQRRREPKKGQKKS
jgi:hypothetical protein